jgi:hypothetical protein
MQSTKKLIVLEDGEDVTKLKNLNEKSLQKLLNYQGDSSAFDNDD